MKRIVNSYVRLLGFAALAAVVSASVASLASAAADPFQELVNRIPRSANAVMLLNMEKARASALGAKEGWEEKIEKAFEAGLTPVPPQATRFVLAAQLDFEFIEPMWQAVVLDLDEPLSIEQVAKLRGGERDTIEGFASLARPNDTYVLQLEPTRYAAMAPANRQSVVRWIREVKKAPQPPLSPYLQKAAVYSDRAGSEIIMALDLEGVASFERVGKYVKAHEQDLKKWQGDAVAPLGLTEVTRLLSTVEGVRLGLRVGDQVSGKMVLDFRGDAAPLAPIAKPLLIQILSDSGALINDFQAWTVETKGNEVSLSGALSASGLRRLMSVIDSPADGYVAADAPKNLSPGEIEAAKGKKSRDYFRTVVGMADDLKDEVKHAKNLASTQLFFDKYAKRIERMPILGIDEELVNYGAYVANTLRKATGSVKTMGIQSGVREASIISSDAGYGYAGYSYGRYGVYGGYGGSGVATVYNPRAEARGIASERRVVRAEEKATMATDVQGLRADLISVTAETRRKMTQKYQIEF